jgi:hypothetical protein
MQQEFSIVLSGELATALQAHLSKGNRQEDLTFAAWRPAEGSIRSTAVLNRLILPGPGERILHGNVAFTSDYIQRALGGLSPGEGLAMVHSHLTPGWQGMSHDDEVAERDRVAPAAFGRTRLPLVGITSGTDGSLSARRWRRVGVGEYGREEAAVVRESGARLRLTFHPKLRIQSETQPTQVATVSVWGSAHQADLARLRVGIIGLGSVGSIVAEGLARLGVTDFVLIDHDRVEQRNLDRLAGASRFDIGRPKVRVAASHIRRVGTGSQIAVRAVNRSILSAAGFKAALDCDLLFSCVDRPLPRHLLNALAYSHLIPVIDGGIFALVDSNRLIHVDWRAHTVGAEHACLVCLGALDLGDVALDQAGKLDDPDYVRDLAVRRPSAQSRRNVFPLSLSVAAQEILQMVGLVTGLQRIAGIGPQTYHCYPGIMETRATTTCADGCPYGLLLAAAADLRGNLTPRSRSEHLVAERTA